ncbi:MAG: hypothetical protein F9K29_15435 [Hyphomicrobiaceae bacterium]|nr:MAG: hypothetical protein F9K29_15435 [Hyphomicrobiaceae bacterium]
MNAKTSAPLPAATTTRYGIAHPERVENPLWEQAIREEWSGYALRKHLGIELDGSRFRHDFSHSASRDATPGPFWSWQRFGRTSTPLPDGRVIHVGGEHEDSYDPDFCIYNDVVVGYPDGRREFHLYPKDVFPPTDFHSATLVGHEIVLIGSLGYRDLRRIGETQVLKLDTRTLRIARVATHGETPGWISRHLAEKLGETAILVVGGMVDGQDGYASNTGIFELDLTTMAWHRREHGDVSIFPVSAAVYRKSKNPRYGSANPERSENPFWLAMARHRWPPSRARLHFGDFAPPQPELVLPEDDAGRDAEFGTPEAAAWAARIDAALERSKLKRTIDDIVWTAAREAALALTLPDGRQLLIGGEVPDYDDEYADPWVYNDVIVTHADGSIGILTYPKEVFPHVHWPVDAVVAEHVYIFANLNRKHHPNRSRAPVVLRLDTVTYEITWISVAEPSVRVDVYPGSAVRDGNRVVFPVVRLRAADPELDIAFDLETRTWGEPEPSGPPPPKM